ncbi:MAG: heme ABC transporter ATP-binding protein [Pseudomonadota bacterium]
MFQAENVRIKLGHSSVVQDASFTAKAGEVTAIVGPNGSGKTSLLRALTGEVVYSGRIALDGTDLARMKPMELAVRRAVLPQSVRLAFPFTVFEVVQLGLSMGHYGGRDDLVAAALARVGLSEFAGRYYFELSGGEQQRAQLARVLVQVWEPIAQNVACWLFLDEPVASLDIGHQLEVMQLMRDYADAGGGVVAVMHDLNLTAMFADSVAILNRGRVMQQGSPETVFNDAILSDAYGCAIRVSVAPQTGSPFVLPHPVLNV